MTQDKTSSSDKSSIVRQIEGVEKCIRECEQRLDSIERSLRLAELTDKEIDDLKNEEKELQEQLDSHKKDLRTLRKENVKSMFVSAAVLLVAYGIYYVVWT